MWPAPAEGAPSAARAGARGRVDYVYGYSFILTELQGDPAEIEVWHRQRGQMEERVQEVKLGDGPLHFPFSSVNANRAWQTAGVIQHDLITLLCQPFS